MSKNICSVCSSPWVGGGDLVDSYYCSECGEMAEIIEVDEDLFNQNQMLARKAQKHQDLNRIERKTFRADVRELNAIESLLEQLNKHLHNKHYTFQPRRDYKRSASTAIIHLTDLHLNELVDVPGNEYDFDIASARLYKFAQKCKDYITKNNIGKVFIAFTGDIINSDRRDDEKVAMATSRAKATIIAVDLLGMFIADVVDVADVELIFITGNESRLDEKFSKQEPLLTNNLDFMIGEMLTRAFTNTDRVKTRYNRGSEYPIKINGTSILMTHGDSLGAMDRTSVNKVVSKWAKVSGGFAIQYIICGHIHETMITDTILRGGSLVGNNAFAKFSLQLSGCASQNLYLIDEDGTFDSIRVDLQKYDLTKLYDISKILSEFGVRSSTRMDNLHLSIDDVIISS